MDMASPASDDADHRQAGPGSAAASAWYPERWDHRALTRATRTRDRCSESTRGVIPRNCDVRRSTDAPSMAIAACAVGAASWADRPGDGPGDGGRREDDPARLEALPPGRLRAGGDRGGSWPEDLAAGR